MLLQENVTIHNGIMQKRKKNRLEQFDYSTCGAYFLTVCTVKRRNYFWEDVALTSGEAGALAPINDHKRIVLSNYGKILERAILRIPEIYPAVVLEDYVIMPDHVHLLLMIRCDENGRPMVAPTMSRVIQQMKGIVTKEIGCSIWQKLFYDHVIRNTQDYEEHVKYIQENPIYWHIDNPHKPM